MLFQIYGETALYQLLGFVLVFTGLVLANEFARRTKTGGIICFLVLPASATSAAVRASSICPSAVSSPATTQSAPSARAKRTSSSICANSSSV